MNCVDTVIDSSGRTLCCSGSNDRTIRIWNLARKALEEDNSLLMTVEAHDVSVVSVSLLALEMNEPL